MRRRLLNLLTLLSLLLCVAAVALWVRSRWVADRVECFVRRGQRTCGEYILDSSQGNLVLTCRTISFERSEAHDMFVRDRTTGFAYASREAYQRRALDQLAIHVGDAGLSQGRRYQHDQGYPLSDSRGRQVRRDDDGGRGPAAGATLGGLAPPARRRMAARPT